MIRLLLSGHYSEREHVTHTVQEAMFMSYSGHAARWPDKQFNIGPTVLHKSRSRPNACPPPTGPLPVRREADENYDVAQACLTRRA
jgi:hypothetical protein